MCSRVRKVDRTRLRTSRWRVRWTEVILIPEVWLGEDLVAEHVEPSLLLVCPLLLLEHGLTGQLVSLVEQALVLLGGEQRLITAEATLGRYIGSVELRCLGLRVVRAAQVL